MTTAPTNYSIVAVDVEGYGARVEVGQAAIRRAMYESVEAAAAMSGVEWSRCVPLDRGDSILLLVPPSIPPTLLIDPFVATLDGLLRQHNALRSAQAVMRMRIAVHAGYLSVDPTGWVGTAINTASRLLDANVLRQVLRAAHRAQVALLVSDELYKAVVLQGHTGLDHSSFHRVDVAAKELRVSAWIHVPGYRTPDGLPEDTTAITTAPNSPVTNDPVINGATTNGATTNGATTNGATTHGPVTDGPANHPHPVRNTIHAGGSVVGGIAGGDITIGEPRGSS